MNLQNGMVIQSRQLWGSARTFVSVRDRRAFLLTALFAKSDRAGKEFFI